MEDKQQERDALFIPAAKAVVEEQSGSTSLLQRKLRIGYNLADKLMEQMEKAGIVGPDNRPKPRTVLVANQEDLDKLLNQ